jgi:hypothetical protein
MKKLMNFLMLSCRKASALIDKRSLFGLSMKERLMLRVHTGMCDFCREYKKQSGMLDQFLHQHLHAGDETQITQVPNPELKEKISSAL